jgi:uncharacterized protein (TIGR02246 family)
VSAVPPSVVADREAIRDLFARYARAVDAGVDRADEFAGFYLEDGSFEQVGGAPVVGRAALRAFAAALPTSGIRHVITDHVIDVDGDDATCDATILVVAGGRIVASGRARDTLRRVDARWRIATRVFTPDPK